MPGCCGWPGGPPGGGPPGLPPMLGPLSLSLSSNMLPRSARLGFSPAVEKMSSSVLPCFPSPSSTTSFFGCRSASLLLRPFVKGFDSSLTDVSSLARWLHLRLGHLHIDRGKDVVLAATAEHWLQRLLPWTVGWARLLHRMGQPGRHGGVVVGRGEGELVRGLLVLLGGQGRPLATDAEGRLAGGGGGRHVWSRQLHFPAFLIFKIVFFER